MREFLPLTNDFANFFIPPFYRTAVFRMRRPAAAASRRTQSSPLRSPRHVQSTLGVAAGLSRARREPSLSHYANLQVSLFADSFLHGAPPCAKILPCLFARADEALAGVAELADAYGSGPYGGNPVKVQVLSPAPLTKRCRFCGIFLQAGQVEGADPNNPFIEQGAGGIACVNKPPSLVHGCAERYRAWDWVTGYRVGNRTQ